MSSSPCPGVTLRRLENGIPVVRVHYAADATMTPERVAAMREVYGSPARWQREMEIEYEALEGERMYEEYAKHINECEPFDVSDTKYWTIWMALDPHMRVPHAALWWAFGAEGESVVFGELWPKLPRNTKEYAETIKWLESDADDKPEWWMPGKKLRVQLRVMDTHGKAANSDEAQADYFTAYARHGLTFRPAKKGQHILEAARDQIARWLRPDLVRTLVGEEYRPRLFISTACPETQHEFENVRFPAVKNPDEPFDIKHSGEEKPETYRKHMLDCMHYIAAEKPRFVLQHPPAPRFEPIYESTQY